MTPRARLQGRVSALRLVFAGCSTSCPIQGAVFAAVAARVRSRTNWTFSADTRMP